MENLPLLYLRAHDIFQKRCCSIAEKEVLSFKASDLNFSILARGRTAFHLSTLEAIYIETSKLNLCKQKEFGYGLKIAH